MRLRRRAQVGADAEVGKGGGIVWKITVFRKKMIRTGYVRIKQRLT
jgi:hypothetical protein